MFNSNGVSLADIAAVSGNRNNDGFGDGGGWWAWIILWAMFGWGGNGMWGNGGNNAGTTAIDAALQRGFDTQTVINKLDGISNGLCSLGYDQLAQMNGINSTIMQTGFGLQQAINNVGWQQERCCCDQKAAIQDLKYTIATENCATRTQIHETGDQIQNTFNWGLRNLGDKIDAGFAQLERQGYLDKITTLQQQLNDCNRDKALQGTANYIVNTLDPRSQPAYLTCNPQTGMVFPNMTQNAIPVQLSNNGGCGCGNNWNNGCCGSCA